MQLIVVHQKDRRYDFIEGFHENYGCITLWNNLVGLEISCTAFFDYSPKNRVPKYTNPFR